MEHSMGFRPDLWLALLLAISIGATSERTMAQETEPRFRTEAEAVVVDAVVRDAAGHPIRCLSKADFRLVEDGIEQQIATFESVGSADCPNVPSTGGQNRAALEASTPVPVTAIVFHELGPGARAAAFRAARAFVGEHRARGEFVGVFALDFAVHTMTPYTRDESVVLTALRRAAMRPGCPETVTGTIANAEGAPACPGSVGEITAKATLSSLQAVVRSLAPLPGRKNVLVFSEGFRISTGESAVDQLNALGAMANQYAVTLHTIDAAGLRTMDWRQEARRRLSSYAGGEQGPGGLATKKQTLFSRSIRPRPWRSWQTGPAESSSGIPTTCQLKSES
jgi:VWFA-related protein